MNAQTNLYNESFDGNILNLPTGWNADTLGWIPDTASANVSTDYAGASGLENIVIKNATGKSGTFNLISKSISTVGYNTITVLFGARNTTHFSDSGSAISSFDWSTDGGVSWNPITYTNNPNNSTWALVNGGTKISLPSGVEGQANLIFRWVAQLASTSSGTYRIDDFSLEGNPASGINENIFSNAAVSIYPNPASCSINISIPQNGNKIILIYDLAGKKVVEIISSEKKFNVDRKNLSNGIYLLKILDEKGNLIGRTKLVMI